MRVKKLNYEFGRLGRHIVFDFWGCSNLNSPKIVEKALREAVDACGATLLEIKVHAFSPYGVSGIAVIAESHISIHTWPEHKYAAADVFTCGEKVDPVKTLPIFKKYFKPKNIEIIDLKRGAMITK